ncbi:uncharacterized protein LOC144179744 [Haemaphysalis longicornis]
MSTDTEAQADTPLMENGGVRSNGNGGFNHAPVISIDPGVESGLLLRVPNLPFSREASSAESLAPTTPSQFLNLPGSCEHRRHSMQDCCHSSHQQHGGHHHGQHRRHRDRKRSCPDVRSSADRRRRGSRSPLAPGSCTLAVGGAESASVTPSSSRRSSASSLSRRSSRDNEGCPHSRRSSRADDGSRRSSKCDESRRSSRTTDDMGGGGHSSRRSSRSTGGEDERRCSEDRHHHHTHRGSHHPHRRESSLAGGGEHRKGSSLLPPDSEAGSRRASKVPALLVTDEETGQQRKPDDELDSPRRRIIIFVISSVACFILLMSVVLIAVTLTISPAIDSIGEWTAAEPVGGPSDLSDLTSQSRQVGSTGAASEALGYLDYEAPHRAGAPT